MDSVTWDEIDQALKRIHPELSADTLRKDIENHRQTGERKPDKVVLTLVITD